MDTHFSIIDDSFDNSDGLNYLDAKCISWL